MTAEIQEIRASLEAFLEAPNDQPRTPDLFHYYSSAIYELELEHIWKKEWIAVGHMAWLKRPGDYFAWEIMDEPILFVLGEDNTVRGLSSICRHRYVPVTEDGERGCKKFFKCPYHQWSYDLDGKLRGAPFMKDNKAFNPTQISLPEFRVEVWNGIIFVNFDDNAAPLAPRLEGIAEEFRYCDREDLAPRPIWDCTWDVNWKQAMENGDVYHGPSTHPEAQKGYRPLSETVPTTFDDYWAKQMLGFTSKAATEYGFQPGKNEIGMVGRDHPAFEMIITPPANFLMLFPGALTLQLMWPISIDKTRVIACSILPPEFVDNPNPSPEELVDPEKMPESVKNIHMEDLEIWKRGVVRPLRSSRLKPGLMSIVQEGPAIATHRWRARQLLTAIGAMTDAS